MQLGCRRLFYREVFFFFKQKTAYELRISDWSSDVCSSDLAAARAAGEDIIDLGMGNPDLPPPAHVIEKLCEVAMKPDAHGYSQSKGIPGLRRAQANY